MIDATIAMPKNVLRFEALLYLSILLDILTSAFLSRDHLQSLSSVDTNAVNIILIIVFVALIGLVILAARRRKNWARWVLVVWQVLSVLATLRYDMTLEVLVSLTSSALALAGLYFSFTGDARNWFDG